jgi:nucleotide-binding universal stress UspA family protein
LGRDRRVGTADVERLIVPLDGSVFAERAVQPALKLAGRLGVEVTAVFVSRRRPDDEGPEVVASASRLWDGWTARVDTELLVGDDAGLAIAEYADRFVAPVVCMSSHGRRWPASTFIGSTASMVLARSHRPVIVFGPSMSDQWVLDGPVLACVDGHSGSEAMLPTALGWAALLGVSMDVVMVAEPAPVSLGPVDPSEYVASVARSLSGEVTEVTGTVIWDPVGVGSGLERRLRDRPGGLLAISGHSRPHRGDQPVGHHGLAIIHDSPVPLLVVPLPAPR